MLSAVSVCLLWLLALLSGAGALVGPSLQLLVLLPFWRVSIHIRVHVGR